MTGYRPLITAHTGCEDSPENTIASILRGIKAGADIIEIDIRSTADGRIILMHDEGFHTRSSGYLRVHELPLQRIRSLYESGEIMHLSRDAEITVLEDALKLATEKKCFLNLDLKDDLSVELMCRLLEDHGLTHSVVISGCDKSRAARVKESCRGAQVLLNVKNILPTELENYDDFMEKICRDAISGGYGGLNIDYRLCRQELIRYAQLRYLPVAVWTINDAEEMNRMIRMGVYSITTYHPQLLSDLLAN